MKRWAFVVSGQVQGVGFRPFVWRLAYELGLSGFVGNTLAGVRIEVQGRAEVLSQFEKRLKQGPPLACITKLTKEEMPAREEKGFHIESSGGSGAKHTVLISPDVAVCEACLQEINDKENRRAGYAFTNCTDCGPRYTITRLIPYDRATTSMACFPLCENCKEEYENPASRRFHAQPNACAVCGPTLWLQNGAGERLGQGAQALHECVKALQQGKIVAIKGLGGFHLACDARNQGAVSRLRQAKQRPHKAFALMVKHAAAAKKIAQIGPDEQKWLESPARPIVLCRGKAGGGPAPGISPDTAMLGIMLPGTPLHYMLFPEGEEIWVMTSGNAGGDPICLGNREAVAALAGVADLFLCHNRDILIRVDDSVLQPLPVASATRAAEAAKDTTGPLFFRRARGYVPQAISLHGSGPCVLACGAELKNTFCITRGNEAFVSQHMGDMSRQSVLEFFTHSVKHLCGLLGVQPEAVVCDRHPDYLSTRYAEEFAADHGLPLLRLWHHEAHIRSVLAERGHKAPALGLALDGSGLGQGDAPVWGGELLLVNGADCLRVGRLKPFLLAGGEAAIRHPWRIAEALWPGGTKPWEARLGAQARAVREMLERKVNCTGTSSCGRLFDAVSAGLGLCFSTSYEGQAALLLEQAAWGGSAAGEAIAPEWANDVWQTDSYALFARTMGVAAKKGKAAAAFYFHDSLAASLAALSVKAALQHHVQTVALAGGVMQNMLLRGLLKSKLEKFGLKPLFPQLLPPGDGGLCLGQAAWGRNKADEKGAANAQ